MGFEITLTCTKWTIFTEPDAWLDKNCWEDYQITLLKCTPIIGKSASQQFNFLLKN